MIVPTGVQALSAAEKFMAALKEKAEAGETFELKPDQAQNLLIILGYLMQGAGSDEFPE